MSLGSMALATSFSLPTHSLGVLPSDLQKSNAVASVLFAPIQLHCNKSHNRLCKVCFLGAFFSQFSVSLSQILKVP